MIKEFNVDLFVLALESRSMSQQDFATKTGVDKGLVSRWRNEISIPTETNIKTIADVLGYPSELFYRPERVRGSDSVCIYHRKRKAMPSKQLESLEAKMHFAQLHAKWIISELAIESDYAIHSLDPEEHGGPEGVAQTLRAFWRIPSGPIRNLIMTVEAAGAVVLTQPFGTRLLDGMSAWAKNSIPLFYVNSELATDRLRWCIAHELGHLVMHATPPLGDQERQAEDFAREFLMPKTEIHHDLRRLTFQSLGALKQIWRVPMKELITAASRWDALPENKIKSLAVQYSRAGFHTAEPWELSPETPNLFTDALNVHRHDHNYQIEELAVLTGLHPQEFASLYEPATARRLRSV